MPKVVINACIGVFGLSHAAHLRYAELKGITLYAFVDALDAHGHLDLTARQVPYDGESRAFWIYYYTTAEPTNESCFSDRYIPRDDPDLVRLVEELGEEADDKRAKLAVVDVPDGVEWEIADYDGREWVAEVHQTWY